MPQIDFTVSVYDPSKPTEIHEIWVPADLPGDTVGDIISAVPDLFEKAVHLAAWNMASMEKDQPSRNESYSVALRTLKGLHARKAGATREYIVDATYGDDGGPFGDRVHAVDEVDAEFQTMWTMAENVADSYRERTLVENDLPKFLRWMDSNTIHSIEPAPSVSPEELQRAFASFYAAVVSEENLSDAKEAAHAVLVRAGLVAEETELEDEDENAPNL